MLPFEDRFSRQRRLPEVGVAGQRTLEGLRATVYRSAGRLVEERYLVGSGVSQLERLDEDLTVPFPLDDFFQSEGPRHVARGAWGALRTIRMALGVEASPTTPSVSLALEPIAPGVPS